MTESTSSTTFAPVSVIGTAFAAPGAFNLLALAVALGQLSAVDLDLSQPPIHYVAFPRIPAAIVDVEIVPDLGMTFGDAVRRAHQMSRGMIGELTDIELTTD